MLLLAVTYVTILLSPFGHAAESFEQLKTKAEKGDGTAQYKLGVSYDNGIGVTKNAIEAAKWLRKAAEQGNADAQNYLGLMYALGTGVVKDITEAVKWLRKAAEQGNADAQSYLGLMYAEGAGVVRDQAEAVKLLRRAAEQGNANAQNNLGLIYVKGDMSVKDQAEAMKWFRKASDQGDPGAQHNIGAMFDNGIGVTKNEIEAVKWYRKAAQQEYAAAQFALGNKYDTGEAVVLNQVEAVKWFRKAAEQGYADAQNNLGLHYAKGDGVPKDDSEAYKWLLLAGSQGDKTARQSIAIVERRLSAEQRTEGQRRASAFKPREQSPAVNSRSQGSVMQGQPEATGSGFFITEDGYLITNQHVVGEGASVRLLTSRGALSAVVVKVDGVNDLALLKAEGKFSALPITFSRSIRLGATVATVGFPNIGLQGFAPKLAKGEIASLTGAQDDVRHFQISTPVQPGNSGGALVDERGNVVGVVVAKLSQKAALATSGVMAENVNYAVKSSYLLSFLESVPEVAAKLKEANTKAKAFEDVVKELQQAAVLVIVY